MHLSFVLCLGAILCVVGIECGIELGRDESAGQRLADIFHAHDAGDREAIALLDLVLGALDAALADLHAVQGDDEATHRHRQLP